MMRSAIAATLVVTVGFVLASMLGVAAAEAPTTTTTATPARTVSVDGVASVPIAQDASLAQATLVYREAMAAAVADGQGKAEFLASKTAVTLAGVQSVVEGGGSIQCTGEGSEYTEYEGEQPDFGTPEGSATPVAAPQVAATRAGGGATKPTVKHPKKKGKKKRPAAKAAAATSCTLHTDVTLVYTAT
jgi:hypothetical protein